MRFVVCFGIGAAGLALALAACSSADRPSGFDDGKNADGTSSGGPIFGASGGAPDASGGGGCAKAEAEAKKAPVDVILSVDQSGSMSDDLVNVKNNINKLANFLQATGLDYHVVMIGEPGNGTYQICVPPPLGGANCASKPPVYKSVPFHIESTDTLRDIISTLAATPGSTYEWGTFLRKDAVKAFVPITDDNSDLAGTEFDKQLLAKPGDQFGTAAARRYVMYPIIGSAAYPAETGTCGAVAVNNGSQYIAVSKLTKGKWFPICLTDFGPVFQEIAKNIAAQVACELPVPKPTDGSIIDFGKVNVTVTGSKGGQKDIFQDNKACEGGADGWQYNADKTKIVLCGPACESVRGDPGSKVSVQFGCETRIK